MYSYESWGTTRSLMLFQDELNICTRTDAIFFFFLSLQFWKKKKYSDLTGIQICDAEALELFIRSYSLHCDYF